MERRAVLRNWLLAAAVLAVTAVASLCLVLSGRADEWRLYVGQPKQTLNCRAYLQAMNDPARREALEAWADSRLFGRDLGDERFRYGTARGLGNPRLALAADPRSLGAPEWLPADAQIRLAGESRENFGAVWIGSPRLRGLVVVRDEWAGAFHHFYLPEDALQQRQGRVGFVCVTD